MSVITMNTTSTICIIGQTMYSAQNAFGRCSRVRLTTQSGATKKSNGRILCITRLLRELQIENCKLKNEILRFSICNSQFAILPLSLSINFTQHDVQRSNKRHYIGYQVPDGHFLQRLQIDV